MLARISFLFLTAVDFVRGRVIPMYRRSGILFASRYLTLLGRTFLRTPMFTEAELKVAKGTVTATELKVAQGKATDAELKAAKDKVDTLGLGPIPAYMRDGFYNWTSDRSVQAGAEHLNASILLSVYRNKSYKDLSWRVFVVGLLLVGVISITDSGLWWAKNAVVSVAHRAAYAVSGPTKIADNTDDVLTADVKKAITAARAAKPELDQSKLDYIADTGSCSTFLSVLPAAAQSNIDKPASMLIIGDKLDVCRKAGYAYRGDLVQALKPFQDRFTAANNQGNWDRLVQATTLPGQPTSLKDFSKCDAILASVLTNPSPVDFTQAYQASECLGRGAHLPTVQD